MKQEKMISMPYKEYEALVKERDELKEKIIEIGSDLPSVFIDYGDIGFLESGRIVSDRPNVISSDRIMNKNNVIARCPILSIKTIGDVGSEVKEALRQNQETLRGMIEAIKEFKQIESNSKATRRWWMR